MVISTISAPCAFISSSAFRTMPDTSASSGAAPNRFFSTPMRVPLSAPADRPSRKLLGRRSRPPAVIASAGSSPTVASSSSARSVTVRASGPPMSCVCDNGMMPVRLDSPRVPRRPNRLLLAAGMRIDPHVSLAIPPIAKLAATAAAVPPLDPPGVRARS